MLEGLVKIKIFDKIAVYQKKSRVLYNSLHINEALKIEIIIKNLIPSIIN